MRKIHIVIPDLFLPRQLAAYAYADLHLPALEKLLARGRSYPLGIDTLETWLCGKFGLDELAIAPLTLLADGVQPGADYWLRADPVAMDLQREQLILKSDINLGADEAAALCATLNAHFAADGFYFVAPHPQRWYLRLKHAPVIRTHPLPQVTGANMHEYLPEGDDALRWHGVLNEIQMLFYSHAVNRSRELRGEPAVGGVWLWGGGQHQADINKPYARVLGDSELTKAFAQVAGVPVSSRIEPNPAGWADGKGALLLVCERLRSAMQCANIDQWRQAAQLFEKNYAEPLFELLSAGDVEQITLDVLSEKASRRFVVSHSDMWKIWRTSKPLLNYTLSSIP